MDNARSRFDGSFRLDAMPIPRRRRPAPRRNYVVTGAAAVLALALSGCVGAPPAPTPTPSAPAEPIFASDEEALAAAEEAYAEFENVSQSIASDSGNHPERIETVATPAYAQQLLAEFAKYRELEIRAEGLVKLDSFSMIEHRAGEAGVGIMIYVCRDVSGVRVLDATGADVTPDDRVPRTPLIASLIAEADEESLLVDGVELWSGEDFC